MKEILFLALAVGAISFTITTTSIFMWFRELVSPIHHKIEELIHCPWCLSHYIAILVLLVTDVRVNLSSSPVIDFILTLFTVVGANGLFHYVILRAYEPVMRAMVQRKIEKLNK